MLDGGFINDLDLNIEDFTIEELEEYYSLMTEDQRKEIDSLLRASPPTALMPHQVVPIESDWWDVTLLVGGRGIGKTVTGAYAAREHLNRWGTQARIGIGAPTNADARDTCMEGQTGLYTLFKHEFEYYNRSLGEARHIKGGFVKAMGTEKAKRWNGPQWSMLWFDELALCNQESWDDANLGLRIPGPKGVRSPYAVCTTTPKNRKFVKNLAYDAHTYVPQYIDIETGKLRVPNTRDNHYLPQRRVDALYRKYSGSRIGRQELEGVFVDDIDGAMFKRKWIEDARLTDNDKWPRMLRRIVTIDPAGSSSRKKADDNALTEEQRANHQRNAQTAIAVMGLGEDGHLYLLHVEADWYTPKQWAFRALHWFHYYRCDRIIAERNYGGDMVLANISNLDEYDKELGKRLKGSYVPVKLVSASRGKDIRAEPVSALYEQGRVHHCRVFGEAEDQMCAFINADDNEGADMVDAIVWGGIELGGLDAGPQGLIVVAEDPIITGFVVM